MGAPPGVKLRLRLLRHCYLRESDKNICKLLGDCLKPLLSGMQFVVPPHLIVRSYGMEIVISAEAFALVQDRVHAHPRGSFAVRGRKHEVEVFELLGVSVRAAIC